MSTINHYNMLMANSCLMTVLRPLAHTIYRALFPSRIQGIENYSALPTNQPLIITCNHIGHHDPVLLVARFNRNLHFLAKSELLDGHFGWFFRHLGLVRVDRNKAGSGLAEARKYLEDNKVIVIFPEGTTKFKDMQELLPFKHGAVKLAIETGSPILPVAIMGRPRPLWFGRCRIQVGHSYHPDSTADVDSATHYLEQLTLQLMRQAGATHPKLLPGKPARNPSKERPVV